MPIRSMATTAFHHWMPQSAPWLFRGCPLKPNLCCFELSKKVSSWSFVFWISFSISWSTSIRKSVTSCRCGWALDRSWGFTGVEDECGISSWGWLVCNSVKKLCFWTGILMVFSANKSCSCMRLFTRFISVTCWQKHRIFKESGILLVFTNLDCFGGSCWVLYHWDIVVVCLLSNIMRLNSTKKKGFEKLLPTNHDLACKS